MVSCVFYAAKGKHKIKGKDDKCQTSGTCRIKEKKTGSIAAIIEHYGRIFSYVCC